ncbi:MAG: pyruvate:ferredoxin (flavodoxin) oxidoreductase [Bacilli bacterium]|nr:pyruvate:ferredoxin (flavodoxin) oxidoreductase [Bacilli bacterium]
MKKYKVIDGNEACSYVSYMFTEVAGIYPITPASPMSEYIDVWANNGRKNIFNSEVKLVEMQSEAGAIALCHGALQTGTIASTYTSSQGLLLMIPSMYKIAGEMLPCVINVASRTVATHALSIFGDHSDIYATRSSGFSYLASSSVQDVPYMTLISYLSTLKGRIPFVNFFDGFRTSHELNKIELFDMNDIKSLIPKKEIDNFRKESMLYSKKIRGTAQNDDVYFQNIEARNKYYEQMPDIVNDYMEKVNDKFKTNYKPFNYYGSKNATKVIVAMGSVCSSIKELVDILNENKEEVGLIEVHLFRPFSKKYFMDVLPKTVRKIAVLDRAKEAGATGDVLYTDVVNILNDVKNKPFVVGGRYGLSSKDTNLEDLYAVYKNLDSKNPINSFTIGITDDITNKSLKKAKLKNTKKNIEMLIYGYGSDGMISASKDIVKQIGETTEGFTQGYFQYDSKKSGGVTKSHIRIDKEQIKASYYIENPHIVVVTKDIYLNRYDVLSGIRKNGIFILNTDKKGEELEKFLPNNIKKQLAKKNIKFYIIDAYKIASKNNIPNKISTIMESAIINITKLLPYEEYLKGVKKSIKDKFTKKGKEIVENNINSIKEVEENIIKIKVKSEWKDLEEKETNLNGVFDYVSHLKGDELTTKDLEEHKDGTFECDTTKKEKRDIAERLPRWIKENCIECNQCSIVCPHGCITPKLLNEKEIKNNPNVVVIDTIGNTEYKFALEFSYENCTGCGVCANTCPGKVGAKALMMEDAKNVERINNKINDVTNKKLYMDNTIKGLAFNEALFKYSGACAGCGETPYIKMLTQIFNDGIIIANATGCSSIYGGSLPSNPYNVSWSNSLFEDNAEYGLGMKLTIDLMQNKIEHIMKDRLTKRLGLKNIEMFNKWLSNKNNSSITKEIMENINYDEVKELIPLKGYIQKKDVWIIGGDGWSYDIGFGGIDHIMASGEDVNILVLDTEVYSNTGGQSSKSTHKGAVAKFNSMGKKTNKKDLAKMMMNYDNVYVACISLGANMAQAIKAFKEAAKHNGPSLIIAYAPCINHGIKKGMSKSIEEERLAVQSGYFPIFRYDGDKKEFELDFKNPDFDLYDKFLEGENRYTMLKAVDSKLAKELLNQNKENAKERFEYYKNYKAK